MGENKMKKLEADTRARQAVASGRETELYGTAAPGYKEFAATGGISPEEKEMTRRRTASGISSMFGRLRSALQRRSRVQGGYAPGLGAQQAKLGRQAAAATGEALTGTDLGLLQGYEGEQQGLLGIREALERKRRGVLGTIGAGVGIAKDVSKMFTGYGDR